MNKQKSNKDLFLELAKPDKNGFSRRVYITEFVGDYFKLKLGNGGSWCRDDSSLAKEYNVHREKERGRIVYIELQGFNLEESSRTSIPKYITNALKKQRCVVLDVGTRIEIDHKDGFNSTGIIPSDFQPMSKAVNDAKRQHCKNCRNTGIRFDATRLGFPIPQVKGGKEYVGTCVGCYWFDPKAFIKTLTNTEDSETNKNLLK